MKWTNRYNLPDRIIKQIGNIRQPKKNRFSITDLIDCPRIRTLQLTQWDELIIDYSDFLSTILGISLHERQEKLADTDDEAEVKFEDIVDGMTVVGKSDNYDTSEKIIRDTKVKAVGVLKKGNFMEELEKQLNCYAWQRRKRDYEVLALEADIYYRDWKLWEAQKSKPTFAVMKKGRKKAVKILSSMSEALEWMNQQKDSKSLFIEERPPSDYPIISVDFSVPVKLWTFEEQEEFIKDQLEYHNLTPMDCDESCRWNNNLRCHQYCRVRNICKPGEIDG